jgi:hypothetical protein
VRAERADIAQDKVTIAAGIRDCDWCIVSGVGEWWHGSGLLMSDGVSFGVLVGGSRWIEWR